MTKVVFFKTLGRFTGLQAEGHSGYAEAGSDIICSAISTAFGIVECAVNDVAKAKAPVACNSRKAALRLILPPSLSEQQKLICDGVIQAAYLWLSENLKQYGAYVQISVSEQR